MIISGPLIKTPVPIQHCTNKPYGIDKVVHMKTQIRKILAVAALCFSATSQAGPITDYSLSGDVVSNSVTGKQWLQWTSTVGMNVSDALTTYQPMGWRVASNKDVADLLSDFFPTVSWSDDEETSSIYGHFNGAVFNDGIDFVRVFGDLFGWTTYEDSIQTGNGVDKTDDYTGLSLTSARFGLDSNDNGLVNFLTLSTEFTNHLVPETNTETVQKFRDLLDPNPAFGTAGIVLIRDKQVAVSEPASLSLLMLGLAGLVYTRRKTSL